MPYGSLFLNFGKQYTCSSCLYYTSNFSKFLLNRLVRLPLDFVPTQITLRCLYYYQITIKNKSIFTLANHCKYNSSSLFLSDFIETFLSSVHKYLYISDLCVYHTIHVVCIDYLEILSLFSSPLWAPLYGGCPIVISLSVRNEVFWDCFLHRLR
jgi:hypothetical protein